MSWKLSFEDRKVVVDKTGGCRSQRRRSWIIRAAILCWFPRYQHTDGIEEWCYQITHMTYSPFHHLQTAVNYPSNHTPGHRRSISKGKMSFQPSTAPPKPHNDQENASNTMISEGANEAKNKENLVEAEAAMNKKQPEHEGVVRL